MSLNFAEESLQKSLVQDYMMVAGGIVTGKVSIMSDNTLRYECLCSKNDVIFFPVGDQKQTYMMVAGEKVTGQVSIMSDNTLRYECFCSNNDAIFFPVGDRRQNIETIVNPLSILGDSMDLETTGPETSHSGESQVFDDEEDEEESKFVTSTEDACGSNELDKHPELEISGAGPSWVMLPELQDEPCLSDEDPLSSGENNNRLPPDGCVQDVSGGAIDTDTNDDDNDVEIISSVPTKKSRIGQKSQCPKCEEMVSTSNLSRHMKQYHRPGIKNHRRKFSSMPESVKIKCEFCGKGLAKTSLTRHIREVHQGQRKRCRCCKKFFSFSHSLSIHEKSCSENPNN